MTCHETRHQRPYVRNKILDDYNLCLNTGEPTYRHRSHHSFSVPDISVYDPSQALEFNWQTHGDFCGSNHFPVILNTFLLLLRMMNLLMNTGNSTRLTGCHSPLNMCRGWSFLRIQWLSLLTFRLKLRTKPFLNPIFVEINSPRYPGLTTLVN